MSIELNSVAIAGVVARVTTGARNDGSKYAMFTLAVTSYSPKGKVVNMIECVATDRPNNTLGANIEKWVKEGSQMAIEGSLVNIKGKDGTTRTKVSVMRASWDFPASQKTERPVQRQVPVQAPPQNPTQPPQTEAWTPEEGLDDSVF